MLYRVLAGRPPYVGKTADSTQEKAKKGVVIPPDQLTARPGQQFPRRLVAMCLKALSADPAARYQTAAELKGELEDFIRGTAQLPQLQVQAGEVIITEGDAGDRAYVILDGHCQASRMVAGKKQELRLLGPGEMFGETAILTGAPRSASVTALMDTTLAVVDAQFLQEEMERSSFMSLAVRTLASSFLDLNGQSAALLEEKAWFKGLEVAYRALGLEGIDGDLGTRIVEWGPVRERMVAASGLPVEALLKRIAKQKGLDLTDDGYLVLRQLRPGE
jgi:serine/threonine-protein kinase